MVGIPRKSLSALALVCLCAANVDAFAPSFIGALARAPFRASTARKATISPLRCSSGSEVDMRSARLLKLKEESGMTWDFIAQKLGLTNAYTCQLFLGQAQLKPGTEQKLTEILTKISEEDLEAMRACPMRGFDDEILKDPHVYRTYEAITHYGKAIKMLINEQCGDGIMSAIDFYLDVGSTIGKQGEKRVVITFNGKFLPFIEQKAEDNTLGPGPRI